MLVRTLSYGILAAALLASTTLSASASQTVLGIPSPLKPVVGQATTVVATVSMTEGEIGTLNGAIVELLDGTKVIGSELASAPDDPKVGTATFTFNTGDAPLVAGNHKIVARLRADLGPDGIEPSTSRSFGMSVKPAKTTLELTLPTPRLPFGLTSTLTAKVAPVAPSEADVDGTVLFFDGTKKLGEVRLKDNLATLDVVKLAYGPHRISARGKFSKSFTTPTPKNVDTQVDFSRGPEYTFTGEANGDAGNPAVFYNPASGGALVAFDSQIASKRTTFLQFIDENGVPIGKPSKIPFGTAGGNPAVTVNRNGEYLVGYESGTAPQRTIDVRLFDYKGDPKARYTFGGVGDSSNPALGSTVSGNPVVAYQTTTSKGDGNGSGIAFAISGTQDVSVVANTTVAGDQTNPAVQLLTTGKFAVAWSSPVDGGFAPFFQIIDDNGAKIGGEIQVAPAQDYAPKPALMAGPDGGVIVAWDRPDAAGSTKKDAVLARFKADGTKIGNISRVDTRGIGDQSEPALFLLGLDKLGAVWTAPDADRTGISVQVFSKTGSRIQNPGLVNFGTTAGVQSNPAITLIGRASLATQTGPDSFIVVWQSKLGTAPATIRLQKFKTP